MNGAAMNSTTALRLARGPSDICSCFASLRISRFHTSSRNNGIPTIHRESAAPKTSLGATARNEGGTLTAAQRAQNASKRAKDQLRQQEEDMQDNMKFGGLAKNSLFQEREVKEDEEEEDVNDLSKRNFTNMTRALNPRPNARASWQRRMVMRHVRRGGRLTKEMKIARTERTHLSRSHFFDTSMKKLAPLARQIAGKSIDEAILQMRFSKKKVAQEVRTHLIQARNEAIVIRGMGLKEKSLEDPSITPPNTNQNAMKSLTTGTHDPTDIYIAEAWTNKGPYGRKADHRARGRINLMRPAHTGISVMLKEEVTRTRIGVEKEAKEIRKRMGKNMWTQLPDRKITNQSQYVLW